MAGDYAYAPQIWPYRLTATLLAALAVFRWRRRAVPGALPFAAACLLALIWVVGERAPAAIFGDAYGNEEAVRRVAAEYPATPFIFGSGLGPSDPNLSVFDDWIHEPAYLCGMLAGGLTESNTIGVVAGFPVPEVNRLINAFAAGIAETNPEAKSE